MAGSAVFKQVTRSELIGYLKYEMWLIVLTATCRRQLTEGLAGNAELIINDCELIFMKHVMNLIYHPRDWSID